MLLRTLRKLRKIWDYLPLLWKDEDWDYAYLVDLLRFKLERMAKCIGDFGYADSNKRTARQIQYAVHLIDRYQMNGEKLHCDPRYQATVEKYGELKFGGFKGLCPDKVTTLEELHSYNEEMNSLWNEYQKLEEEYLDRLFRHIRKYFRGWWD